MISFIEDSLYTIYCQSVTLSTHLLTSADLLSLDQLANDLGKIIHTIFLQMSYYGKMFNVISSIYFYILGVDTNDVPLLMSIATAHTPILNERYSFNFSY